MVVVLVVIVVLVFWKKIAVKETRFWHLQSGLWRLIVPNCNCSCCLPTAYLAAA